MLTGVSRRNDKNWFYGHKMNFVLAVHFDHKVVAQNSSRRIITPI